MGGGSFNVDDYRTQATRSTKRADGSAKTVTEVFTARETRKPLDPALVTVRESCDSEDSPESQPIIIGLDVTGSMGNIANFMAAEGLGNLMSRIIETKPIAYPHLMFMAIGDVLTDRSPLQVSQFEADNRILNQLLDIFVEGNGGGNNTESYDLAWHFAAMRTRIDSMLKRNKKGYLFTIGDELTPHGLSIPSLRRVYNNGVGEEGYTPTESLALAQKSYNVFHLIIAEGDYPNRKGLGTVCRSWYELMGRKAVLVTNYLHITDIIIAVIRVNEGDDPEDVIDSLEGENLREHVRNALFGMDPEKFDEYDSIRYGGHAY